ERDDPAPRRGGGGARAGQFGEDHRARALILGGGGAGHGGAGAGAAQEAGPGVGEVLGRAGARGVAALGDRALVPRPADLPPGAAGLEGGGGDPGGVEEAVGLVEVVLPAQEVEVLDLGETALPVVAAQAFLDVVAFGGPGAGAGASGHRALGVA